MIDGTMSTPATAAQREGYAQLGRIRLHYVEAGEGPRIVLLRGFPEFWFGWRHQIPALAAAGFRVVAPDMRGCNLSSKPKGVRSYATHALAADVRDLIDERGEERAFLVGHDWGATVAWYVAINHPEVVERLAILNVPHPRRMLRALRRPRQMARSWCIFFFQLP
jgi:epoxide hydrolase 4